MANSSICIVSQSHICRNPRVLKEAVALSAAGYSVNVLTAIYTDELLKEDLQLIHNKNISYEFYSDIRGSSFKARLIRKLATILQSAFRFESKHSLGYNVSKLEKLIAGHNAGLYIMHQELATVTGSKMAGKYNVAFDLEDWYSEDLLPNARAKRPLKLLKEAEAAALNKGVFCTTTSHALAKQLLQAYSGKEPNVVYNIFPQSAGSLEKENNFKAPLKLFWFSQTIGPGRGLEAFITLLNSIDDLLELHLLGNIDGGYKQLLQALVPKHHKLIFHQLVAEPELAGKIATFDIGLALELTSPPSRNYTITNKFFQYMQAGLPVIVSDTAGQREIFGKFKPGFLLSQVPTNKEVKQLKEWLKDTAELKLARERAIAAARFYNWENESKKIIGLVKQAFGTTC